MRRPIQTVAATAVAAVSTAVALSGCSLSQSAAPATQPMPTATPADPAASPTSSPGGSSSQTGGASSAGGPTRTIQGPSEDMQWGPVQVTVTVQGKRITDVQATYPTERQRSAFINQQAVPMLRQEVLQAQVAGIQNIYGISGATLTSEAYYQSLMAALQQAGL